MARSRLRKLKPGEFERLLAEGRQDEALLEEGWRLRLRDLARLGGFERLYHTLRSRGSDHGWPDEVFGRREPEPRVVYIELKRDGQDLTVDQYHWLEILLAAGQEAYAFWMPSDWEKAERVLLRGERLPDGGGSRGESPCRAG
jgi:hypothetical protein